ncbi:hypothetical protein JUNP479_4096 [Aeromonas jandaei]|nr:hypothetical protein JUNP479_4096 [Aeromonas jandaei]
MTSKLSEMATESACKAAQGVGRSDSDGGGSDSALSGPIGMKSTNCVMASEGDKKTEPVI